LTMKHLPAATLMLPLTSSACDGLAVPIPTEPLPRTLRSEVPVEDATLRTKLEPLSDVVADTKSEAEVDGVEVPILIVLPLKLMDPVNVLLSARSVEEAAVIVMLPPLEKEVLLMVPSTPERRLVPIVEVAMTLPEASVARSALVVAVRR